MANTVTESQIRELAKQSNYDPAAILAIIKVETGGRGFDRTTGKILIQFEPRWFQRTFKEWAKYKGTWTTNGVETQPKEWLAFNDAFKINPDAAMQSTSWGLPQIMGFHYRRLGYSSVGAMLDDFKTGEAAQVKALMKFLKTDARLDRAVKALDWAKVAYYYNGEGYKQFSYDIKLDKAYRIYK